jgi:hypothetical protein
MSCYLVIWRSHLRYARELFSTGTNSSSASAVKLGVCTLHVPESAQKEKIQLREIVGFLGAEAHQAPLSSQAPREHSTGCVPACFKTTSDRGWSYPGRQPRTRTFWYEQEVVNIMSHHIWDTISLRVKWTHVPQIASSTLQYHQIFIAS